MESNAPFPYDTAAGVQSITKKGLYGNTVSDDDVSDMESEMASPLKTHHTTHTSTMTTFRVSDWCMCLPCNGWKRVASSLSTSGSKHSSWLYGLLTFVLLMYIALILNFYPSTGLDSNNRHDNNTTTHAMSPIAMLSTSIWDSDPVDHRHTINETTHPILTNAASQVYNMTDQLLPELTLYPLESAVSRDHNQSSMIDSEARFKMSYSFKDLLYKSYFPIDTDRPNTPKIVNCTVLYNNDIAGSLINSLFHIQYCVYTTSCFDGYIEVSRKDKAACKITTNMSTGETPDLEAEARTFSADFDFNAFVRDAIGPDELFVLFQGPELRMANLRSREYNATNCSWRIPFHMNISGRYQLHMNILHTQYDGLAEVVNVTCPHKLISSPGRLSAAFSTVDICPQWPQGHRRQETGRNGTKYCDTFGKIQGILLLDECAPLAKQKYTIFEPYGNCSYADQNERPIVNDTFAWCDVQGDKVIYRPLTDKITISLLGDSQTRSVFPSVATWLVPSVQYRAAGKIQVEVTSKDEMVRLMFKRLPFYRDYLLFDDPTKSSETQNENHEWMVDESDILVFQSGQWPASGEFHHGHRTTRQYLDSCLRALGRIRKHILHRNTYESRDTDINKQAPEPFRTRSRRRFPQKTPKSYERHAVYKRTESQPLPRPIRFIWQGLQPVAPTLTFSDCDWRTQTRITLWNYMMENLIHDFNSQLEAEITQKRLRIRSGAKTSIAILNSLERNAGLVALYAPDGSHLTGTDNISLADETIAKLGICRY